MNDNSVRTVGEYKVVNAIHIGDKEIILGENMQAADNNFYMVCFSERNDIFEYYNNILVSDNFIEIAEIFSDRLREQIDSVKKEIENESQHNKRH